MKSQLFAVSTAIGRQIVGSSLEFFSGRVLCYGTMTISSDWNCIRLNDKSVPNVITENHAINLIVRGE